jgi:DNA-binding transcriptional MerR regulator
VESQANEPRKLSIAEVSEATGFTRRALRFYEDRGFLAPVRVGNRRHYTEQCLRCLDVIADGKRLGMSLDDIALLISVEANDVPESERRKTTKDVLQRHQKSLLEIHARTAKHLQSTEEMLARL